MYLPKNVVRAASALAISLCAMISLHACDTKAPEGDTKAPEDGTETPQGDTGTPEGEAKARASDCFACHAVDQKLVGPAYVEIAKRYAGQGQAAVNTLVEKVKKGGSGNWGDVPMTAHPQLSDADLTVMVQWILSLKPGEGEAAGGEAAGGEVHTYQAAGGEAVQTDFAVFAGSDQKQVTDAVFHGYLQYNSYCFRCHGGDAVGGELAPDLRKSLDKGMTYQEFLSVAMAGRPEKGMPAWAGFFEKEDIRAIYEYIKARQLGLVPAGRPPSAQD